MTSPYDEEGFEYFVIPTEFHEVARKYLDMLTSFQVEMKAAHEAHQKDMNERHARFKDGQRVMWTALCNAAGVDADASWDKPNWHIEGNYINEGFVALTTHAVPEHPLAAMLKQARGDEEEEKKTDESVPEGTVLN